MVGVPRFTWCVVGPSSLIGWPKPWPENHPTEAQVPSSAQIAAKAPHSKMARMNSSVVWGRGTSVTQRYRGAVG
jgi:hypothetical protein